MAIASWDHLFIIPAKAYSTVDPQNAKFVATLGSVCNTTERRPTSALLSAGLEKRGNIAVASGGLTDVWQGQYNNMQVAIKAFRIYSPKNLKEAKEVRPQSALEVGSQAKFTDPVETSTDVEEAIP